MLSPPLQYTNNYVQFTVAANASGTAALEQVPPAVLYEVVTVPRVVEAFAMAGPVTGVPAQSGSAAPIEQLTVTVVGLPSASSGPGIDLVPTVRDFTMPDVWQVAIATRVFVQLTPATTPEVRFKVTSSLRLVQFPWRRGPDALNGSAEAIPHAIKPASNRVNFFIF